MIDNQKAPVTAPNIMREEKKITLPYDKKLKIFMKKMKK
jgi:hypothetical protein